MNEHGNFASRQGDSMKFVLSFLTLLSIQGNLVHAASQPSEEIFGVHLFFDEKEFVDIIHLNYSLSGEVSGKMHVPNDFDGPMENLIVNDKQITFDILVPKNSARPNDLIFHYQGQFFDRSRKQMIGFVTLKQNPGFLASFVGFLRASPK